MFNEDLIKKGVVDAETEANPIKTASDEVVERVKACSPVCKCKCGAKGLKENLNENSK